MDTLSSYSAVQKPKTTARDFFLHLGVVATLYTLAVSLLQLLFQVINYAFPDRLAGYGNPYSTGLQISVATLVVVFPLYIFLSWLLAKGEYEDPSRREVAVRKWLLYLTLFLAGVAVAIDLITLVRTFLSGEISVRFTLKILSVLIVAGGIFSYYLYDLKRSDVRNFYRGKIAAIIATCVIVISIAGSFFIMGSPMTARAKRFDAQRISDLQNIQWQVVSYWQQKEKLPSTLSDLEDSISGYRVPKDSETDASYVYTLEDGGDTESFSLCATFLRSTIGEKDALLGRGGYRVDDTYYPSSPVLKGGYYSIGTGESWEHEKGEYCFPRTIDPERYPSKALKTPVSIPTPTE
ncbi:MAG: DUF5671 domain-containing protein [Patescibacteria group bacterium]|nr:DUF5671 domain-containing protein [Patescibacteria group bacterium]